MCHGTKFCLQSSVVLTHGSTVTQGCNASHELCVDLGGKIIDCLSCGESVKEAHVSDPAPCDFRGLDCEFKR